MTSKPETTRVRADLDFGRELAEFGAKDFAKCYQCATCSAACPLSTDEKPFPRKEMLWAQWGLKERLARDLDVWTCYYCGDCSAQCPRGAEPGETMMALRRYATSRYDWTGISRLLYTSRAREIVAVVLVGLLVVGLFAFSGAFTPERMRTDTVSMETFIPWAWVHWGDWVMAGVLSILLLSNAFRMWRFVMDGEKAPLSAYLANLKTFVVHAATQKKWRECRTQNGRWLKHFVLVPAYASMLVLVMFFLESLQVDGREFTALSWFGYGITAVLLLVSGDAILGRLRRKDQIHKHSHDSDWMFLILLFGTALTGILVHVLRIADWPLPAYLTYVVHLALAVPMLVLEVPFMKWAHLMYRPLALYLRGVKRAAAERRAEPVTVGGGVVAEGQAPAR